MKDFFSKAGSDAAQGAISQSQIELEKTLLERQGQLKSMHADEQNRANNAQHENSLVWNENRRLSDELSKANDELFEAEIKQARIDKYMKKSMYEVIEENERLQKAYIEITAILGSWIAGQQASIDVAIQLGEKSGMTKEEVVQQAKDIKDNFVSRGNVSADKISSDLLKNK